MTRRQAVELAANLLCLGALLAFALVLLGAWWVVQ